MDARRPQAAVPTLEERARSFRTHFGARSWPDNSDKVMPLGAAIRRFVRPGAAIHIAYSDARPNAAIMEIVRQFDATSPGFTLSTAGLVNVQQALIARGLVKRLICSFAGENYPAPRPSRAVQRALAEGKVEIENWSLWSIVARLVGGALGVEYFPVKSILGSDMEAEHLGTRFARIASPFGGDTVTGAVRSYRPDITIVQGVAADAAGNVVMAAPFGEAYWGAMAARQGVIACVERVVGRDVLRRRNDLVAIPAHVVRAVCEVPLGSHPYGLYSPGIEEVASYVEDHDFMVEVQRLTQDAEAFDEWIKSWITGLGSHEEYLAKLGRERVAQLRGEADPAAWELQVLDGDPHDEDRPPSEGERLVVAASRLIMERIRTRNTDAVLAGVGYSNLAAWLAVRTMRQQGHHVELMAEIGMFGYDPRPGEPFIFSLRNLPTCNLLTDVQAVLGTFVGGPGTRSIGAVGAAQIDRRGRINSTWSSDGRFLVGSGGANDIASATDELVVTLKHRPGRLVEEVPYVTSPGDRVGAIVTSEAVLERRDGEFELTRFFLHDGESPRQAVERVVAATGWPLRVREDATAETPPTTEELATVRQFDPRRTFL